ncbi:MAG: AMP-binding enzyme, partial [Actinomycetota bacterium]
SVDVQSGWLRTGDLGAMVEGFLRIDGRRDDLIITGGSKVWPHVVEQRLREHPLVADVAVRGVSDADWGSSVCAWVVPKEKNHPPSLDVLRSHVKETLAAYCAPQRMAIIERIPRNSLGKVLAADLPAPVVARQ